MKLTVLGRWGPYPRPGGACSGYLVRSNDVVLLLDAGHGVFSRLYARCDFRDLSFAIISHLHPDHTNDLFAMAQALRGSRVDGSRTSSLPVYLPREPADFFGLIEKFSRYLDLRSFEEIGSAENGWIHWHHGSVGITAVPVIHGIPAYALAIEINGKRLVYSGDTAWSENLMELARDADLFLCEASVRSRDGDDVKKAHLTAGEAGCLAREAGVKRLVLTHFWPEYNVAETLDIAKKTFGLKVEAAQEGITYSI